MKTDCATGTETVLIIDDDDQVRRMVGRVLTTHGYRIGIARDAVSALAIARASHTPFDLVIADIVLPGASGLEIVAGLPVTGRTKVLYMSGYTDHTVLRDEARLSDTHFIQKPFTPSELARKVRAILDINRNAG